MTKLVCGFLVGFYPPFFWLFLLELLAGLMCIVGAIAALVMTVGAVSKGQPVIRFVIVWVFVGLVGVLPGFIPSAFGAIMRAKVIGTDKIVQEGRAILAIDRGWADKDIPWEEVEDAPPALRSLRGSVRVCRDRESDDKAASSVVVKMYGLGDFAGFRIVPDGQKCRGLRVADGLYWSDTSGFW
jgi:hypothetical protein